MMHTSFYKGSANTVMWWSMYGKEKIAASASVQKDVKSVQQPYLHNVLAL